MAAAIQKTIACKITRDTATLELLNAAMFKGALALGVVRYGLAAAV